jgi:hypothetical protein
VSAPSAQRGATILSTYRYTSDQAQESGVLAVITRKRTSKRPTPDPLLCLITRKPTHQGRAWGSFRACFRLIGSRSVNAAFFAPERTADTLPSILPSKCYM